MRIKAEVRQPLCIRGFTPQQNRTEGGSSSYSIPLPRWFGSLGCPSCSPGLGSGWKFTVGSMKQSLVRSCCPVTRFRRHFDTSINAFSAFALARDPKFLARHLDARSSDGSVHLRPRRAARRRLEPVSGSLCPRHHPCHRAPLISTTPHGATRMAVRATVDTTRSHAGAPVRDGLRLINA